MDSKFGTTAAALMRPEYFDAGYQDIAARVLAYRETYHKPPGWEHIDELFGAELKDATKGGAVRKRVEELIGLYDGGHFNPEYVLRNTQSLIRWQRLKAAVVVAGERIGQAGDMFIALEEVEGGLQKALSTRGQELDAGVRLSAAADFSFLDKADVAFPMGIKQFDEANAGATHKQILLYIAAKGTGKTWFCVHMGKRAFQLGAKVLHISLEWPVDKVLERYVMSLWSAARYAKDYKVALFERDELGRALRATLSKARRPAHIYSDPELRRALRAKIKHWGVRLDRVIIKDFSSGSLTITELNHYLDYLEQSEHFVPDLLILDYPRLMKHSADNLRIDLGNTFVMLRGICQERNMAGVFPHQGNRKTIHGKHTRSSDVSEDISVVHTADTVVAYSRTDLEKEMNRARLVLEHTREGNDGIRVAIAQAYDVGQYVIASSLMTPAYEETLFARKGKDDEEEE